MKQYPDPHAAQDREVLLMLVLVLFLYFLAYGLPLLDVLLGRWSR